MLSSKPWSCLALAFLPLALAGASAQAASWPVKGKVLSSHPVKDSLGTGHVVLASQASSALGKDTRIIRAYRFNEGDGGPVKVWQMNDGVEDCALDKLASFSGWSPAVTDLDGNGLAEIWTSHVLMCRGDVGSADLTIVMHEGRKRHAMRGQTLDMVPWSGNFVDDDGRMDQAFLNAPKIFRDYAQNLWYRSRFAMRPLPERVGEEPPFDEDEVSYPVPGKVVMFQGVKDKLGDGCIVYAKEERRHSGGQAPVLRAFRFAGPPASPKAVWRLEDGPARCGAGGAFADFFATAPILTDLDGNGIDEVWTGYVGGCRGTSRPADLKIVMHEGKKRYVMHGKLSTASASVALQGDEGVMDRNFRKGPSAFRRFAAKLWQGWRTGLAR